MTDSDWSRSESLHRDGWQEKETDRVEWIRAACDGRSSRSAVATVVQRHQACSKPSAHGFLEPRVLRIARAPAT